MQDVAVWHNICKERRKKSSTCHETLSFIIGTHETTGLHERTD